MARSGTYALVERPGPLRRTLGAVLSFLMPQPCVHCRREGDVLCQDCIANLPRIDGTLCKSCGERIGRRYDICADCAVAPPPLDKIAPVYRYHGPARSAVLALKFRSIRSIAPIMARPMAAQRLLTHGNVDCIVAVPTHAKRLRERGYNQAELLAREVSKLTDITYVASGLRKVVNTPSQIDLSREERAMSVRSAFESEFDFADAHVLLIDDVATTCSTLMSCASALKHSNAKRVSAVTFAKEYQELERSLD